jgi:hypothetical protein
MGMLEEKIFLRSKILYATPRNMIYGGKKSGMLLEMLTKFASIPNKHGPNQQEASTISEFPKIF